MSAAEDSISCVPGIDHRGRHHTRMPGIVIAASVLLLIAVIAGACGSESDESTVPDDVEQLVEDFTSALDERDPDAFLATLTDDFFNRRFLYEVRSQELSDYWRRSVDCHRGPALARGRPRVGGKHRLYGPDQPFFDQTWKPGDVVRL